jgi:hypothetical protein
MGKKLFLTLLIPAVLVLGGYLYLRFNLHSDIKKEEKIDLPTPPLKDSLGHEKLSTADLRPLLIKRLQQLLKKASNGLYDLSVYDLKTDILSSRLLLQDILLKPNPHILDSLQKAGLMDGDYFQVSAKSLEIEGINFDDVVTSKTMDYKLVKLVHPVIIIHHKESHKKETAEREDFSQRFLTEMQKLDIKKLLVEDGTIILRNGNKHQSDSLNKVDVVMRNILLDSATRKDKQRFLFAKNASITFHDYYTKTDDGIYHLKIGEGTVHIPDQQVSLRNLSFTSPLSKEQFEKRQKVRSELYHLNLPSITVDKVDWWSLFNREKLVADEIRVKQGKFSIYLDRSLPPGDRMGHFPNQLLMNLPIQMDVKRIKVRDMDVSYTEFNPSSKESGTIYLDGIRMEVAHITNSRSNGKYPLTVNGTSRFMHRIPIHADFSFSWKDYNQGVFSANIGCEKEFEDTLFNSFAMPLGLVRLDKGILQDLEAHIKGDQWRANGDVLVLYKDLKLSVLEKDKGKASLDKKDVTSFIANTLVLKKDNPKESKEPRKEKATFRRMPEAGFIMLVWKTILVGTLKTIGAPEKKAYPKGE